MAQEPQAPEDVLETSALQVDVALQLAEIRASVKAGLATVVELRDAHEGWANSSPGSRARLEFAKVRAEVQAAMADQYGQVQHHFYAKEARGFAVQFSGGRIFVLVKDLVLGSEPLMRLFTRIDALHLELIERLDGEADRRQEGKQADAAFQRSIRSLLVRLYAEANNLLGMVNAIAIGNAVRSTDPGRPAPSVDVTATAAATSAEVNDIEADFRLAESRMAKRIYLQAVLTATGAAGLLGFLAAKVLPFPSELVSTPLTFAMAMGTLGAALSVVMRLMNPQETVAPEVELRLMRYLGLLRPLVGAAFALALTVLVRAALVPVAVPTGGAEVYFFGALGFLSGYGERWAQDMVFTTQGRMQAAAAKQG